MTTAGRLRGRATFATLAAEGHTVRNGPVRVRFLAAPDDGARVGYAIGRAVGDAVVRNRVRRRLRAAVAGLDMSLTSGFYLISAETRAAAIPFSELVDALAGAVRRLETSGA